MNNQKEYPDFKDLTEADFNAIISEYHAKLEMLKQKSDQIRQLENEHKEADKTMATLRAIKAYQDKIKKG